MTSEEGGDGLPDWVEEAARLTRAALSDDEGARERRDALASERGYEARLREDGVLVLHPEEWLDDEGVVNPNDVHPDEAYEVPLDGGGYDEAREANDALLGSFVEGADDADVFNARAFVEFCENHHAVAVENARGEHVEEFLGDYYVRNVWADEEAEERVEESLRALLREAGRDKLAESVCDYTTK